MRIIERHACLSVSLLFALVAPLISCSSSDVILRLGGETITQGDVQFVQKTTRCYGDTDAVRESAVAKLTSDLLEYEVLRTAFGDVPPDTIIFGRAAEIQRSTRDSATLACILALNDNARYHRLVIRPTLVNPRLHARFAADSAIHLRSRDSIERIYQQLVPRPELFLHYHLDTFRIPKLESDPFVTTVLARMNVGSLWPNIIETDDDFRIVMLHGMSDSLYQVLALRVVKRSFDAWYRSYVTQHIPIRFNSDQLEADIRKRYPALWWLPASL
jgi:hypothetical protein